jgi:hypothetical protein
MYGGVGKGFWTVDGNGVRWFGFALFIAGGVLRLWPIFTPQGGSVDWWQSSPNIS